MWRNNNSRWKCTLWGKSWKVAPLGRGGGRVRSVFESNSSSTVREMCEAANGFRFKAEGRVRRVSDREGRWSNESLSFGFGDVLTFGLFLSCFFIFFPPAVIARLSLFVASFMPPARNPSRPCDRHRSCSSRRADRRGWASLLGGREHETLYWVTAATLRRLLLLKDRRRLSSWPGLRVCVYPTPTRQALSTLACGKKQTTKMRH